MPHTNRTVDVVKGMAILMVVYGHVIQRTMAPNGADFFLNPAFKIIYTFHMPLFFFLSGYLMVYSLNTKTESDVFAGRCRRLLVPFLSWGILGVLTAYAVGGPDGLSMNAGLAAVTADQLLVHPAVWFLFTLFAMAALLLYSVKLAKTWGWPVFPAVYLGLMLIPFNQQFCLYYIQWFYPFFAAGYLAHRYGPVRLHARFRGLLAAGSLIAFAALVPQWERGDYIYVNKMIFAPGAEEAQALRLLYRYAVGFLGIYLAWFAGERLQHTRVAGALAAAGVFAFDIYLLQRYLVEGIFPRVVAATHVRFDYGAPFFLGLVAPALTFLFAGACLVLSSTFIRSNPGLNRFLLGGDSR